MRAQTLAASNGRLRKHVMSALIEVMTGVTRQRSDDQTWTVTFRLLHEGGLVADVRGPDGGHAGAWRIRAEAL